MIKIITYIGIGGFIGSVARYYLASYVQTKMAGSWPFGTFAVNLIGCFVIGLIYCLAERAVVAPGLRLLLVTGLCGGFTTFSAFSMEIFSLLRAGQFFYAISYMAFSLLLGLGGVWAGMGAGNLFK